MLESVYTSIAGTTYYTRLALAAPATSTPIVLVHGLSVSSRYMVPTAKALAPYRRVYAPDLPGFGKSAKPRHVLDIPALTDALQRWLAFFAINHAVFLGNSMGCQIIAELAVREPECIARAVFVGPTMDRAGRTMLEQARRLALDGLHEPLSSILTQGSDYMRTGPRRTIRTLQYALADRIEDKMPAMTMPVLITRGTDDPIAPRRWCEELTTLLPNGMFREIPGSPHAANYDAPAQLARLTLDFINDKLSAR